MTTSQSVTAVVAVWDQIDGLFQCARELESQLGCKDELIIVSSISLPAEFLETIRNCRIIHVESGLLIPELWGIGMKEATNDLVAITTSHFLPNKNWLSEIREAHRLYETPAIGGFIAPPNKGAGTMANWGTYFLRYSQYLRYRDTLAVDELAGDNAAYKRREISDSDLEFGFWELDYHRQLLQQGEKLMFVPKIRVVQIAGFGFWRFVRQRFQHGVKFGLARRQSWGWASRIVRVLASPLIPVILFTKVLARVLRGRRYLGAFMISLPALSCFILAWALGETIGYLWPARTQPQ